MSDHLIQHAYTVLEIERMRKALYDVMFPVVWTHPWCGFRPGTGGKDGAMEEKIERQLRTYMLNGTRPDELEAIAQQREEESERQRVTVGGSTDVR